MIHLKRPNRDIDRNEFAVLVEPDLEGQVHSTEEMHARIMAGESHVLIAHFLTDGRVGPTEKLTAAVFCRDWIGD